MEKEILTLTPDKLKEIYTDEKFRNEVASAHGCYTSDMKFKHFKTCSWPVSYIVTQQQIDEAKKEEERARLQAIEDLKGEPHRLVFVGMGMSYGARYDDDVCNYRIRTEFMNVNGRRFFVEFGTSRDPEQTRCDHSIDRDLEIARDNAGSFKQGYNNYKNLERHDLGKYTKANILNIVNRTFDCLFTEVVVDEHNLTTDDFVCVSPKSKVSI